MSKDFDVSGGPMIDEIRSGEEFLVIEGQHRVRGPVSIKDGGFLVITDRARIIFEGVD